MANIKSINGNPIVVGTSGIEDNAVTTAKLADNAVTTAKLTDGAVTTPNLADNAVTTAKLADGVVTTPKLADGSITTLKLADNAVTDAKLAQSGGVLEKVDTKAPAITDTASGAIASFDDGADDMPVKKLVANIEPVQDLHGYYAPWPGGGGKNLCNGIGYAGAISSNIPRLYTMTPITSPYNNQAAYGGVCFYAPIKSGKTYAISSDVNGANQSLYYGVYASLDDILDSNKVLQNGVANPSFTSEHDGYVVFVRYNNIGDTVAWTYAQVEEGSSVTTFAPYSNICPISGWTGAEIGRTGKNLIDDSIKTAVGSYVFFNSTGYRSSKTITLPAGTYTFSVVYADSYASTKAHIFVERANNAGNIATAYNATSLTFTLTKMEDVLICMQNNSLLPEDIVTAQLELGSTATDYEPYSGNQISVTFPSEAGTVYGGTLDVTSGKLTVDRAMVDLGTQNWTISGNGVFVANQTMGAKSRGQDALCSQYTNSGIMAAVDMPDKTYQIHIKNDGLWLKDTSYSNIATFKAAMSGVQLVYELATPIEYQLTPQEVTTLYGTNNIWADTGDVEVTYPVDTKLYIDNKITQAIANALNS